MYINASAPGICGTFTNVDVARRIELCMLNNDGKKLTKKLVTNSLINF